MVGDVQGQALAHHPEADQADFRLAAHGSVTPCGLGRPVA
jgi:hypothetical protein